MVLHSFFVSPSQIDRLIGRFVRYKPFVTVHLRSSSLEVRLFTMLSSIGTPLDVTAEEIHIETYFPADDATEAVLRAPAH